MENWIKTGAGGHDGRVPADRMEVLGERDKVGRPLQLSGGDMKLSLPAIKNGNGNGLKARQ